MPTDVIRSGSLSHLKRMMRLPSLLPIRVCTAEWSVLLAVRKKLNRPCCFCRALLISGLSVPILQEKMIRMYCRTRDVTCNIGVDCEVMKAERLSSVRS